MTVQSILEDEAQQNLIEEEKRKSIILTDVSDYKDNYILIIPMHSIVNVIVTIHFVSLHFNKMLILCPFLLDF